MKRLLASLALLLALSAPALAQQCPTRPTADSTNACASTAFVHNNTALLAPGGSSGQVQTNNGSGGFAGITNAQLTALCQSFTNVLPGCVPASGGGSTNFLRADGTWQPVATSFANPTASVGLTTVNGVATTAMRSDAAPSLSQAISPTWTNPHIFAATAGTPLTATPASGATGIAITSSSGLGPNIVSSQTVTGNVAAGELNLTHFGITDSATTTTPATQFINGLDVTMTLSGSPTGNRQAIIGRILINGAAPSGAVGYAATVGQVIGQANIGGTNTGAGALGFAFGGNFTADLTNGATNYAELAGMEVNTEAATGSSVRNKLGISIIQTANDKVAGANIDSAFVVTNASGAVGWTVGIDVGADGIFPIKSTGTLLRTVGGTVDKAFDLSTSTVTTCSFKLASGCTINGPGSTISAFDGAVQTIVASNSVSGVGQVGTASNHALLLITNNTTKATLSLGLQVGSPTGGDKGAGTINVATNIFLNGTAYTNPDFVLEKYFTGAIVKFANNPGAKNYKGIMPIGELRPYLAKHLRLPGIDDEPAGVVERFDTVLEKIEESTLYILQLDERIKRLEARREAKR